MTTKPSAGKAPYFPKPAPILEHWDMADEDRRLLAPLRDVLRHWLPALSTAGEVIVAMKVLEDLEALEDGRPPVSAHLMAQGPHGPVSVFVSDKAICLVAQTGEKDPLSCLWRNSDRPQQPAFDAWIAVAQALVPHLVTVGRGA